jgi:hypothetical protein
MEKPEVAGPVAQKMGAKPEVDSHKLRFTGKMEIVGDEFEKRSGKTMVGELFPIILRGGEKKKTDKIVGYEQSLNPVPEILTR